VNKHETKKQVPVEWSKLRFIDKAKLFNWWSLSM